MYKYYLAIFSIVLLGGYVGFKYFTDEKNDSREAINKSVDQAKKQRAINSDEEALLRLQLAVISFMSANNGEPPALLDELVPKYIDRVPEDPITGQRYAYERSGNKYSIGQQTRQSEQSRASEKTEPQAVSKEATHVALGDSFINPNTMVAEGYIYDPLGKRDPFLPFDLSSKKDLPSDLPPLERYKLGQLRLTAVIADLDGVLKGNVEDEQGKGYLVEPGTKVGDNGGVVVKVEADRIKILETQRDLVGNETSKVIEMTIQKKAK